MPRSQALDKFLGRFERLFLFLLLLEDLACFPKSIEALEVAGKVLLLDLALES